MYYMALLDVQCLSRIRSRENSTIWRSQSSYTSFDSLELLLSCTPFSAISLFVCSPIVLILICFLHVVTALSSNQNLTWHLALGFQHPKRSMLANKHQTNTKGFVNAKFLVILVCPGLITLYVPCASYSLHPFSKSIIWSNSLWYRRFSDYPMHSTKGSASQVRQYA